MKRRLDDHNWPDQTQCQDGRPLDARIDQFGTKRGSDAIRDWALWIERNLGVLGEVRDVDPDHNQDRLTDQEDQREREHPRRRSSGNSAVDPLAVSGSQKHRRCQLPVCSRL